MPERPTCAYGTAVRASGDSVGNLGSVRVDRCHDGSTALQVATRNSSLGVWLTRQEATDLALALMNAAHGTSARGDLAAPDATS